MPLISMTFSMKLIRLGEQLFSGSLHPSMISFRVVSSLQVCILTDACSSGRLACKWLPLQVLEDLLASG